MINKLLEEIGEDKTQNMSTTSFKFKEDIWEYFQDFKNQIAGIIYIYRLIISSGVKNSQHVCYWRNIVVCLQFLPITYFI